MSNEKMTQEKDIKSGMDAMGHPIPEYRKQNAMNWLREEIGLNTIDSMTVVIRVSNKLQRDHPFEAMEIAQEYVDMTGVYRLLAYLLSGNKVNR